LRQKIHHVQRLKEEVGKLSQDNARLSLDLRRAANLLRDHRVPFVAAGAAYPATGHATAAGDATPAEAAVAPPPPPPPQVPTASRAPQPPATPAWDAASDATAAPSAHAAKENNGSNRYFFAATTPGGKTPVAAKAEKTPAAGKAPAGKPRARKPLGAV
jgi:hypothetical protein